MGSLWGYGAVVGLLQGRYGAPHDSRASRWVLGPGTAGRGVSGSLELLLVLWGGQGCSGAGGELGRGRQSLEKGGKDSLVISSGSKAGHHECSWEWENPSSVI